MWTSPSLSYAVIKACRREVLILSASTKNEERLCNFDVNISWFAYVYNVAMLNSCKLVKHALDLQARTVKLL